MDQNQQAQQELLKLKAEIHLLTRNQANILRDIEQLQATKKHAFKDYDLQIKLKKDELESLTTEGKRLQGLVLGYQKAFIDIEKNLDEIKEKKRIAVLDAEEAVKTVYGAAEKKRKEAEDLLANAAFAQEAVEARENAVIWRESEAKRVDIRQTALDMGLDNRKTRLDIKEEELEKAVAKAQELLDDIDGQITRKKDEVSRLDVAITKKTETEKLIGIQVSQRLTEAELILKSNQAYVSSLKVKEEKLDADMRKYTILLKRLNVLLKESEVMNGK